MKNLLIKDEDLSQYINDLSFIEAQSIVDLTEFYSEVADYAANGNSLQGSKLPWLKTQDFTRVSNGKLSIWAGENGSGKSLVLGQVITNLMLQGRKAIIASLEMKPRETLYRMICQSATCKASKDYCLKWISEFTGRLYIYDQLDRIAAERILAMAHYAAHELGVKDIVIDSLTKCGVGRDDYAAQATFVDKLQWCAKRWDVHIHLVCHMRKSGDGKAGGKNDIRGAAEITDLADNVYILRRNKRKEQEAEYAAVGLEANQDILNQPCAYLAQEKNREYGEEKTFSLWYHKPSGLFLEAERKMFPPLEL